MENWLENQEYVKELNELCRLHIPYAELQNKSILVTGATGLICSYLVDALMWMNQKLQLNMQITVCSRSRERGQKRFNYYLDDSHFTLLIGDVCKKELYERQNWDYIIHGAGNSHPKAFATQPVETMKANLLGMINILDYAVSREVVRSVQKVVFLSTGEVYGHAPVAPGQEKSGWKEETAGIVDSMEVRSCYPESKRAAETLCQSYYQEYNIKAVVARLSYIYGATIQEKNSRADAQFLRNVLAKEDIIMKSRGEQIRSYCYLQDAAAAILYLLLKGSPGEVYNVANPDSVTSIRGYAECLAKIFGVAITTEIPDEQEQKGYSKMQREILNGEKLRALGWEPQNNLEAGIEKIKRLLVEA